MTHKEFDSLRPGSRVVHTEKGPNENLYGRLGTVVSLDKNYEDLIVCWDKIPEWEMCYNRVVGLVELPSMVNPIGLEELI